MKAIDQVKLLEHSLNIIAENSLEELISLTKIYKVSHIAHKQLEKIVKERCEQAQIIDYGLSEAGIALKLANTPETRWFLQGELKAIKDGHAFNEKIKGTNCTYRGYVNQDGKPEGVGIVVFDNGDKFSGQYKGGYRNGVIKAEYTAGDMCWGMFEGGE